MTWLCKDNHIDFAGGISLAKPKLKATLKKTIKI
jgi:nicotinate-nucleotide pyrophosphorylase